MSEFTVVCTAISRNIFILSVLWTISVSDSLSNWQSHATASGVVIFHLADTSVVMRDDVPHNSGLTGTMFGEVIHGTINMWLVDIEDEELWWFY